MLCVGISLCVLGYCSCRFVILPPVPLVHFAALVQFSSGDNEPPTGAMPVATSNRSPYKVPAIGANICSILPIITGTTQQHYFIRGTILGHFPVLPRSLWGCMSGRAASTSKNQTARGQRPLAQYTQPRCSGVAMSLSGAGLHYRCFCSRITNIMLCCQPS